MAPVCCLSLQEALPSVCAVRARLCASAPTCRVQASERVEKKSLVYLFMQKSTFCRYRHSFGIDIEIDAGPIPHNLSSVGLGSGGSTHGATETVTSRRSPATLLHCTIWDVVSFTVFICALWSLYVRPLDWKFILFCFGAWGLGSRLKRCKRAWKTRRGLYWHSYRRTIMGCCCPFFKLLQRVAV